MAMFDLPGKTILMHNRAGVRIELNFDEQGLLELWISPQAGKSLDYRDRNFSCRDDHTRLFDQIHLPGLSREQFEKCEYDPFHSVVYFKRQTLHVVSDFDNPVVMLWCEKPQAVDFKSDKADTPVTRSNQTFEVEHPDRGKTFTFAAAMGKGDGAFRHQLVLDAGRSTYARAELDGEQVLAIAGELSEESVVGWARAAARRSTVELLDRNEKLIEAALVDGSFKLHRNDKLQALMDVSRRVLLAGQDKSGAIRAALNRIYYMIWVRDGAIIEAYQGMSGEVESLKKWTEYLLANPTVVEGEKPEGRTFGMLVNKITKWEEDGVFFAIWSAFTAWTQTGERRFVEGENLKVLEEAMDWLERYCFSKAKGLFGRYYHCETPLPGSRGDGYDNATGKPTGYFTCRHNDKSIRRSYDIYINLFSYAAYAMLAAMQTDEAKREAYLGKAKDLGEKVSAFYENGLPSYGDLEDVNGQMIRSEPYGLDRCDYVWGLTIPGFAPEPWRIPEIRKGIFKDATKKPKGYFLASYFTLMNSLDTEFTDEGEVMDAIEYAAEQCYRPGEYLAMPNSVVEMLDMEDGNRGHDVRPQAFSIGPWLATMVGLGLRRLPFGLAVRASATMREICSYAYKQSKIDVKFTGKGKFVDALTVNGQAVEGTLQLPESLLTDSRVTVEVKAGSKESDKPMLLSSTVRLASVESDDETLAYRLVCYGVNSLVFRNVEKNALKIVDASGESVEFSFRVQDGCQWVGFDGYGEITVSV